MNKGIICFLVITFSCLKHIMLAQGIDKPQYQVITHRAGSYLGTFNLELFPLIAPLAVHNFDSLVSVQFYDSTAFHRVVPGFVIQGGDPNSINGPVSTWGQGQPWQPNVPAEFSVVRHLRGILGAARDVDTNSANSQFYICVAPATFLDGQYTVYGQVINGMSVVDTIVASPRDVNDVPLQKIEMFVTYTGVNDTVPVAPLLTVPADNAVGILSTQNFQWTAVQTAIMYTIEFSTDSLFSVINHWRNAGLTSTTMPALVPNTNYYWRVKANNGGHESNYSPIFKFTTATAGPLLIAPPDQATNTIVNPVFEWSSVNGATDYTLQVSLSSVFTPGNIVYTQTGIVDTNHQVPALNPNTLYYWRIRSASNGVQGNYSAKYSFTTGTSVGVKEFLPSSDIVVTDVHPNPANEHFTVKMQSARAGKLLLSLVNVEGKVVYSKNQKINQGNSIIKLSTGNLPAGFYSLIVKMNNNSSIRKIEIN